MRATRPSQLIRKTHSLNLGHIFR